MKSQSMPRFARMIGEAMRQQGHDVVYWAPADQCQSRFKGTRLEKWAGYVDQYLIFPLVVKRRLRSTDPATLFVFCDQALGPWVPLVSDRPHVVHAHDLLALRSALGLIPENKTSWTGRLYQRYIRQGFKQAKHFISVSKRTEAELIQFGGVCAETSRVVYNGLNFPYQRIASSVATTLLREAGMPVDERGVILHVGGDQWYKNSAGVIQLYAEYVATCADPLPLWMISPQPSRADVKHALSCVPAHGNVMFYQGIDNATLQAAYSIARAFLFPSLAEGFGWPIVEAQACGCLVITTDDAPMNEIGGEEARYLPALKPDEDIQQWAKAGATVLNAALSLNPADEPLKIKQRMDWASRFTQDSAIAGYLAVYREVAGDRAC
jgi:glycosyltransferase involved in cell wall biosynthesis